jgi:hypothetical protein
LYEVCASGLHTQQNRHMHPPRDIVLKTKIEQERTNCTVAWSNVCGTTVAQPAFHDNVLLPKLNEAETLTDTPQLPTRCGCDLHSKSVFGSYASSHRRKDGLALLRVCTLLVEQQSKLPRLRFAPKCFGFVLRQNVRQVDDRHKTCLGMTSSTTP